MERCRNMRTVPTLPAAQHNRGGGGESGRSTFEGQKKAEILSKQKKWRNDIEAQFSSSARDRVWGWGLSVGGGGRRHFRRGGT